MSKTEILPMANCIYNALSLALTLTLPFPFPHSESNSIFYLFAKVCVVAVFYNSISVCVCVHGLNKVVTFRNVTWPSKIHFLKEHNQHYWDFFSFNRSLTPHRSYYKPSVRIMTYGDFFSAKKMSPCYKVHKKNCWPALL